jgi:methyl-accepting chemotaxis protein
VAAGQKALPRIKDAVEEATGGDNVAATLTLSNRVRPNERVWRTQVGELIAVQGRLVAQAMTNAAETQQRATTATAMLVGAALLLGSFIAWRITLSVTAPVGRAVVVAERIANGDLTSQVEVRIHDETGRLLQAIAAIAGPAAAARRRDS